MVLEGIELESLYWLVLCVGCSLPLFILISVMTFCTNFTTSCLAFTMTSESPHLNRNNVDNIII